MSAMAAEPPPAPRLDTVLSFSDTAPGSPAVADESATPAFSDAGSDTDAEDAADDFEFAFAPPLSPRDGGAALAPADDLFAHGRIVAAYPLFDRRHRLADHDDQAASSPDNRPPQQASSAPPSPDTYCAWAPRSAPGSPSRDRDTPATAAFPKSSSTGEARRFWRLRDLVSGGGGRSHSDGKEKFVFLQHTSNPAAATSKPSAKAAAAAPVQKQGKKKKGCTGAKAAGATEMDMATAHRLFYGKPGAASAGDRPRQQQQSYLPYRPGIVGFFASAHALGRSHHPY